MSAAVKVCVGYVVGGEPLNLPDGEYHLTGIAPPVAAGSVDTITIHGIVYDAMSIERVITELREENKNVSDQHEIGAQALEKAEARVKELEADRQSLQAEGKHPAPCARHCEANAFQIEVRRLEAESAHKQSIIDRLMLEHCPDEMTPQQVKEWGEHQVRAEPELLQWPTKKDPRLSSVSNVRLHKGYDALRCKDPSINFDFDVDGKTLTLTRQEIYNELEARDDVPIPF